MAELVIKQGEEFKAAVRGKITENDIFCKQYQDATEMLNEIVSTNESRKNIEDELVFSEEYPNNIISFCGNRGEGKSSAIMTFVNEVCKYAGDKSILSFNSEVKKAYAN